MYRLELNLAPGGTKYIGPRTVHLEFKISGKPGHTGIMDLQNREYR